MTGKAAIMRLETIDSKLFLQKKHLMIDIETLGILEDCFILAIAAKKFDLSYEGCEDTKEIELYLDIESQNPHYSRPSYPGRRIDGATVRWWLTTDAIKLKDMMCGDYPRFSLMESLHILKEFMEDCDISFVWSKSPHFDLSILSHAYRQVTSLKGFPLPYTRWLDVRTVIFAHKLARSVEGKEGGIAFNDSSEAHSPLYDCNFQIAQVRDAIKYIRIAHARDAIGYSVVPGKE